MIVKTPIETVEKVWEQIRDFDPNTKQFLDDLPTPDKITVLALALQIRHDYEDFEEAYYVAERKAPAKDLTEYMMKDTELRWNLQDVVQIAKKRGWDWFEVMHSNDEDEEE